MPSFIQKDNTNGCKDLEKASKNGINTSEEIEKYAKIIVLERPGIQLSDEDKKFNFVILDGPRLDISSAEIRSAIKVGDRIDHLVPKSVMDYIYQEGLYR